MALSPACVEESQNHPNHTKRTRRNHCCLQSCQARCSIANHQLSQENSRRPIYSYPGCLACHAFIVLTASAFSFLRDEPAIALRVSLIDRLAARIGTLQGEIFAATAGNLLVSVPESLILPGTCVACRCQRDPVYLCRSLSIRPSLRHPWPIDLGCACMSRGSIREFFLGPLPTPHRKFVRYASPFVLASPGSSRDPPVRRRCPGRRPALTHYSGPHRYPKAQARTAQPTMIR